MLLEELHKVYQLNGNLITLRFPPFVRDVEGDWRISISIEKMADVSIFHPSFKGRN